MARPVWPSIGRSAQHSVNYAYALLGSESQPGRPLEPSRYGGWLDTDWLLNQFGAHRSRAMQVNLLLDTHLLL